jgi:hypothetical protein
LHHEGWLKIGTEIKQTTNTTNTTKANNSTDNTSKFKINKKFNEANINIIPSSNSFYFRLNQNLIYYTEYKEEVKIIDSVHITNLIEKNVNVNKFIIINLE